MTTSIRSTHVVLPDGGDLRITPATIHIDAGRITAVDDAPAELDLGDKLVTPAFVDAHTHLALVGLRGLDVAAASAGNVVEELFYRVEAKMTPEDVRALVRVGAYEALLHGTAVVWDHYYHPEALVEGLRDAGLRGVVAPALQDLSGPGVPLCDHHFACTSDLHARRDLADEGFGIVVGPHATDTVSDDLWRRCTELSAALGVPIHCHLAQSHEEVARAEARAGTTPAGLLESLGVLEADALFVHGLYLTDSDLLRLDPSRHTLGLCPASQAQFGFVAPVSSWAISGLPWVVATDGAATNDSHNVMKELRAVAALRTAGHAHREDHRRWRASDRLRHADDVEASRRRLWRAREALGSPGALLSRVWDVPGSIHPRVRCGALEAGRWAHLAVWDLDHPAFWPSTDPLRSLVYGDCSAALDRMMIAGAWRTTGDHAASLVAEEDWRAARSEASARLEALLARL
jgi:cytosine/adenosine deaminase-related metal-dependent hydrolase